MGADQSRVPVVWRSLDPTSAGYITLAQIEAWFRDELFIGNTLFTPTINGVTTISQLALSFIEHLDTDRDHRVSYEEFQHYCRSMTAEQLAELTLTIGSENESEKKKLACRRIFHTLKHCDVSDGGDSDSDTWGAAEINLFVRHELEYERRSRASTSDNQWQEREKTLREKLFGITSNTASGTDTTSNCPGDSTTLVSTSSTVTATSGVDNAAPYSATTPGTITLPTTDADSDEVVNLSSGTGSGSLTASVSSSSATTSMNASTALPLTLTFAQLYQFLSPWSLRDIRQHFEALIEQVAEEKKKVTLRIIRERRQSKSDISLNNGSHSHTSHSSIASPANAGASLAVTIKPAAAMADGLVDVSIAPDINTTSTSLSLSPSLTSLASSLSLADLYAQLLTVADELSLLNAKQRELNDDSKFLHDQLLSIDSSRLTITQSMNDLQSELTALHSRQVNVTRDKNECEEKLKLVLKEYERVCEEGHRLTREMEVTRETIVSMNSELSQLVQKSKSLPEHSKSIERAVSEQKAKLELAMKVQRDAKQMIAMLELEIQAQQSQPSTPANSQSLARLRAKHVVFAKADRDKQEEIHQCNETIRKLLTELTVDEELKRLSSKQALYKASINEKKDNLNQLEREFSHQQQKQSVLDNERRTHFNDINNLSKTEKLLQTKIQQLTENFGHSEQQLHLLAREKRQSVERKRLLVELQHDLKQKFEHLLVELNNLVAEIAKLKGLEQSFLAREEQEAKEEFEHYFEQLKIRESHGWKPDETHVAPMPYQREPERCFPWCCVLAIDAIPCLVTVNRFLLIIETVVQPSPSLTGSQPMIRICVDVKEILDSKLKTADLHGKLSITVNSIHVSSSDSGGGEAMAVTVDDSHSRLPVSAPFLSSTLSGASPPLAVPVSLPGTPQKSPTTNASNVTSSGGGSGVMHSVMDTVWHTATVARDVTTSLLDTVVGQHPDAHANDSHLHISTNTTTSASATVTASPRRTRSQPSASLLTAPSTFSRQSPPAVQTDFKASSNPAYVSPPLTPSALPPDVRAKLDLEPRALSIVLNPDYRNRFLLDAQHHSTPVQSQSQILSPSSNTNAQQSVMNQLVLTGNTDSLTYLFDALRIAIETRRLKSFTSITALNSPLSSPSITPPSSNTPVPSSFQSLPSTAPSTPRSSKTKKSKLLTPAERKLRRQLKREERERELQRQRDRESEREEIYLEGCSEILPNEFLAKLIRATPARYHLSVWQCVYSMTRHGVSFAQLLTVSAQYPCTICCIKDMRGSRFGGFASVPFVSNSQTGNAYYGTGECWVFKVQPLSPQEREMEAREPHARTNNIVVLDSDGSTVDEDAQCGVASEPTHTVHIYRWSGLNDYFLFTGDSPAFIAMGGGNSYAWRLDANFRYGRSAECETFQSPPLAVTGEFEAIDFEVWAPTKSKY